MSLQSYHSDINFHRTLNTIKYFLFFCFFLLKTNETHKSNFSRRWNLFSLYIYSHKVGVFKVDESMKSCVLEAPTLHAPLCSESPERAVISNTVCTKMATSSTLKCSVFVLRWLLTDMPQEMSSDLCKHMKLIHVILCTHQLQLLCYIHFNPFQAECCELWGSQNTVILGIVRIPGMIWYIMKFYYLFSMTYQVWRFSF